MRLVQHLLGNLEDFYKTGIYKISFSCKPEYVYVGSAFAKRSNPKSKSSGGIYIRLNHHLGQLKRNKHSNSFLQNVFNKHSENIVFEVLEVSEDSSNRDTIESLWMEQFRETHILLNLTPETKLNGRLKPLSKEKQREIALKQSAALKGKIPQNLNEIHHLSKRSIEEYSLTGELLNIYPSLKEFCNYYNLDRRYCSYYLRKQNTIPKIKEKSFKYLSSYTHSERTGVKFKIMDFNLNEQVVNSINDLCILLNTTATTLRMKNVKTQPVYYKGYNICPIIETYLE